MLRFIKKIITGFIDWILYSVLSEKQKKAVAGLFSEGQKERIKQLTKYGKRQSQLRKIKQMKYQLYSLGFEERALLELESEYNAAKDPFMKRLTAWELALWHANEYNPTSARQALDYLDIAIHGEKDKNQLRKAAILKAECYEILSELDKGKEVIHQMLTTEQHPDLYLAAANLETTLSDRLAWINKVFASYGLQPIYFSNSKDQVKYDDLKTENITRKITNGPKVSVILPAYNSEDGIRAAIESILDQTWQNLELLVVDDCSTDRTREVIREYVKKDPRVRLLSTPQNSGPYVARNIALQEATGDFITVNDADDWSHAEKIEIQVTHLQKNKPVIANTSEHARLTEELTFYRRGTPGIYIFSNMSSLMFRRKPVLEKLGSWDSVRFAADGEFKRRLIKEFGKQSVIDLKTGPLSLPRQTAGSLTGSSAFGYNGFFMGARKEYVESFTFYHQQAASLYYPFPQDERLYPVPEPMRPDREKRPSETREFQTVIAADFRVMTETVYKWLEQVLEKAAGSRIGFMQINRYGIDPEQVMDARIRNIVDGDQLQMLVYGEYIKTDDLFIIDPFILEDFQIYVPDVTAANIRVLIPHLEAKADGTRLDVKAAVRNMEKYFGNAGYWQPQNDEVLRILERFYKEDMEYVHVMNETWESMVRHGQ